jgi:hypothetical protein
MSSGIYRIASLSKGRSVKASFSIQLKPSSLLSILRSLGSRYLLFPNLKVTGTGPQELFPLYFAMLPVSYLEENH